MQYGINRALKKQKHKWLKSMFSTSLTIKEIQIKTTLRFLSQFLFFESEGLSSIRVMANALEYMRKRKHLLITGRKVNWGRCSENQCGGSSKKLRINLLYDPTLLLPVFMCPNDSQSSFRGTYQCLFSIHNSQDMETTSMSIS